MAEVYRERYGRDIGIEIPGDAAAPDIMKSFRFSIDKIAKLGYRPTSDLKEEINGIFKLLEE